MMEISTKIPDFSKVGRDLLRWAPRQVGVESEKFFRESFVKGGFTDINFTPWKKTSNPMSGKRTMYRSGTLMRSIRVKEARSNSVIIESDTAYSEIHNNGGEITVTDKMKKYWWWQYKQHARKGASGKTVENNKAKFCKHMALMEVGSKIKIPQHQFMGESRTLLQTFDTKAIELITREMRTLK